MLYIFLEGADDNDFFNGVFTEIIGNYLPIEYAKLKDEKINNYIQSIIKMPDSDYLFIADEDGKGINKRKEELLNKFNYLSNDKLFIVQYEIESWYYAGLDQNNSKKLKMSHYQFDTNTLTKEQFYSKLKRPSDRKLVMAQILTMFDKQLATNRNKTFQFFFQSIKREFVAV